MEPARIAKDRSRLLFFNHRIFHFSPTALASAWNFYHTTPVAHTESSTTLFNPFFQYQLQTRENYFSSPSNKCGANRVNRHACGPGQASRLRTGSSVTLFCSSAAISTSNAWTKLFRTAKRPKRGLRSVATEKTADRALSAVWFIFKINCTWDSPQKLVDHPIKNSPCTWDCPPLLRMVPF